MTPKGVVTMLLQCTSETYVGVSSANAIRPNSPTPIMYAIQLEEYVLL